MTTNSKLFSMSYGCKTADGQHIYGDNGRCLMCWQMKGGIDEVSRVLVIVISGEGSERERVDGLAEILETQMHGILKSLRLTQGENQSPYPALKRVEFEVYAS